MVAKNLIGGAALLSAASGVNAFWRMQCKGRTGMAAIDPIVDEGTISSHAHSLHGSGGLTIASGYDELRNADCTSCAVEEDKSAYWFPGLYFEDSDTGKFEEVPQVGGLLAYYLQRSSASDDHVRAFPPGFRMITGDTYRRDYTVGNVRQPDPPTSNWAALGQDSQEDLAQRALGFNCLDYSGPAEPSLYRHYLPEKSFTDAKCPDGLRLEMMFPSCWNGKDLDSDDHKSHMAFPNLVMDGTCPEGFETRVVSLFFESIWNTGDSKFDGRNGRWVLGNGDPTGFGNHADFMTGWDEDYLQEALDTCTNESGELFDCPKFMADGLQSEADQELCRLAETPAPEMDFDNMVMEFFDTLPVDVPVQDGPAYASPVTPELPDPSDIQNGISSIIGGIIGGGAEPTSTPSSTPVAPAATSTTSTEIAPEGGAFLETAKTSTTSTSTPPPPPPPTTTSTSTSTTSTPTPTPTPTSEIGVEYEIVSTQTVTQASWVQEVVWEQPVVTVTEGAVVTTTVAGPAGKSRRSHLARHNHHGRRG